MVINLLPVSLKLLHDVTAYGVEGVLGVDNAVLSDEILSLVPKGIFHDADKMLTVLTLRVTTEI